MKNRIRYFKNLSDKVTELERKAKAKNAFYFLILEPTEDGDGIIVRSGHFKKIFTDFDSMEQFVDANTSEVSSILINFFPKDDTEEKRIGKAWDWYYKKVGDDNWL
ncbi:hypothetical protein [Eremococcus coleocola]|uniref:hypothetical protein n=1 Tax=Eremococcus coleocola TaxID=88132 RepID=UPI0004232B8A|nr:hypothetical protein [Eremococcus coleocola]